MTRVLFAVVTCLSIGTSAYATSFDTAGSYKVAQTATESGGPSGGPNQAQSVVPSGATGGPSGGPNQAQSVKKPAKHHSKKKMHH